MTRCTPADALSKRREHAKWKVFEYETAEFSGKCVIGRTRIFGTRPDAETRQVRLARRLYRIEYDHGSDAPAQEQRGSQIHTRSGLHST